MARALQRLGEVEVLLLRDEPLDDAALEPTRKAVGPVHQVRLRPFTSRGLAARLPGFGRRAVATFERRVLGLGRDAGAAAALRGLLATRRFDAVLVRYVAEAATIGYERSLGPGVLDVDDLPSQTAGEAVDHARGVLRRALIRHQTIVLRQQERLIAKEFDAVLLAAATDIGPLGIPGAVVAPNIPYAPPGARLSPVGWDAAEPGRLLVVASWNYEPNAHGLRRFLDRCWPLVRRAVPHATLDIAGRMPQALSGLCAQTPCVRTLGFVTDLAPVYAACVAAVAPVYHGGGTKIKVLEALAFGRPCVVTEHAHRGYESTLPHEHGVLVGCTDEALAGACVRLLGPDGLPQRLGEVGAAIVAESFSEDVLSSTVVAAVESALRARGGPRA